MSFGRCLAKCGSMLQQAQPQRTLQCRAMLMEPKSIQPCGFSPRRCLAKCGSMLQHRSMLQLGQPQRTLQCRAMLMEPKSIQPCRFSPRRCLAKCGSMLQLAQPQRTLQCRAMLMEPKSIQPCGFSPRLFGMEGHKSERIVPQDDEPADSGEEPNPKRRIFWWIHWIDNHPFYMPMAIISLAYFMYDIFRDGLTFVLKGAKDELARFLGEHPSRVLKQLSTIIDVIEKTVRLSTTSGLLREDLDSLTDEVKRNKESISVLTSKVQSMEATAQESEKRITTLEKLEDAKPWWWWGSSTFYLEYH